MKEIKREREMSREKYCFLKKKKKEAKQQQQQNRSFYSSFSRIDRQVIRQIKDKQRNRRKMTLNKREINFFFNARYVLSFQMRKRKNSVNYSEKKN